MGFRTIVITQHAKLSYTQNMMLVQTDKDTYTIPIDDINILLIDTEQAVLTSKLIYQLTEKEAKIIFTDHAHLPVCETAGYYPSSRNQDLLLKQVNWDVKRIEILWTKIISNKLINQIRVLDNYHLEKEQLVKELDKLELNDVTNREAVVARLYFKKLFDSDFVRKYETPINAALNYGYAILLSAFSKAIVSNGYLTYFGIHHHSQFNEFNLASDLMEPFRPVVDYWLAAQKIVEFTPDIKYGLVELLNIEIEFNDQIMLLQNAINKYVTECLNYLSGEIDDTRVEVKFCHEVPNNAIDDNV